MENSENTSYLGYHLITGKPITVEYLVEISKRPAITLPTGLTREQRRAFLKQKAKELLK